MEVSKTYQEQKITLTPDYEGDVIATLIHSNLNTGKRKSILYIHGFVDYFFHEHLGNAFNQNDYDFYALDLRKYGRSILPHQHQNYCQSLTEYFEEITSALEIIHKNNESEIFLLGHSTGGLISSLYMNTGEKKNLVKGLMLNSPFLEFNQSKTENFFSVIISKLMVNFSKFSSVNGVLSPAYAQSLHKNYFGEWDFNLDWKPIKGFPTYFIWILAIKKGHQELKKSAIKVPVLVMHSSASAKLKKYSDEASGKDIVLNVNDIKRIGATLGDQVTLMEIQNAKHDIFLSPKDVREKAMEQMFDWLKKFA